ncbi:MAG: hypothetical protein WC162_00535 [Sphaerochaetaceae bacterium]
MKITKRQLFSLWLPLAIMNLVMASEQPMVTGIISRMGDAVNQLAAFGFSFSLALLVEGPVIQMFSAATAVSNNQSSYEKLHKIMNFLALATTSIHLILLIPGIFNFVAVKALNLPEQLEYDAYISFALMPTFSLAVGYRRLWQGVMIKCERTDLVPYVMYIRLVVSISTLLLGLHFKFCSGAALGSLALATGTASGAISAYFYARPLIKKMDIGPYEEDMDLKNMIKFYIPLALTSWITLGVRPLLNFGITLGQNPVESLAVWPVVLPYVFLYSSITQSIQEIIVAQYQEERRKTIIDFSLIISIVMTLLYFIVFAIKPLWNLWFIKISNLPTELLPYIPLSLFIMAINPYLTGRISLFRGILVARRKTKIITKGVTINVCTMLIVITLVSLTTKIPGVYIACIAYMIAFVFEFMFLKNNARERKLQSKKKIIYSYK